MELTNNQKNILWIDIAKFIAMFLVVFEHVVIAFNLRDVGYISFIRFVVVNFHMPLFFLVSGYLYKQRSKSENYEKILWALVIPYFIYQFAYLPFKLGYYHLYENIPLNIASIKCFIGILLGDNLGTEGSRFALTVCPACWFLVTMAQLRFIFAHINMTAKNLFMIIILAFISLKFLHLRNIDLYFCLDNTLYAIPYFAFGYCLKNYYGKIIDFISKHKTALFINLLLILPFISLMHKGFKDILLLQYACGFLGSFAVIAFSHIFKNTNHFVNVIAKNTLFLIFFQCVLLFITRWVKLNNLTHLMNQQWEMFLLTIVYSILIYIVSYFVILLIQKKNWNILLGKYKPEKQV